jgi:predicted secreted protein with PEFG-CTERM motif
MNAVGSRPVGQLIESTDFNIVVAGANATSAATGGANATSAATGGANATSAATGGANATSAATGGANATIPEFSTIALVVLAIAIFGIIIATTRYGRFSFGQRV